MADTPAVLSGQSSNVCTAVIGIELTTDDTGRGRHSKLPTGVPRSTRVDGVGTDVLVVMALPRVVLVDPGVDT
ncbi:MAG: hypothetical protein M3Q30_19410 [Actinomycetota bacterium]|nr:hypothetical protein [Actinomycetota bacterium]